VKCPNQQHKVLAPGYELITEKYPESTVRTVRCPTSHATRRIVGCPTRIRLAQRYFGASAEVLQTDGPCRPLTLDIYRLTRQTRSRLSLLGFKLQRRNLGRQTHTIRFVRLPIYKIQTVQKLVVHFRRLAFKLRLPNRDALGFLAGGGLRISNGQNAVLHRRLDVLGLQTHKKIRQTQIPLERTRDETKSFANLGTIGQPDGPHEPAVLALLDGVPLLALLGRLGGLARNGEVSVLNVDLNVVLGEAGQLERRSHDVLVLVFVQVHPVPQELATGYLNRKTGMKDRNILGLHHAGGMSLLKWNEGVATTGSGEPIEEVNVEGVETADGQRHDSLWVKG